VYRGELALDLLLDILANVEVAGVVTGDVLVSIRATNYFTPARLSGGLAVDVTPDLTVEADLIWNQWSHYPAAANLAVLVALDLQPPLVATPPPPSFFTDTVGGRMSIEYRHPGRTEVVARAGAAWIPSPVPVQVGQTNYADGDRRLLSAGVGIRLADWAPILTRPIDLDLAVQWHSIASQLTLKELEPTPGQAFSSGGDIVHGTASATVRF
jgi:long-subunit fatty acid transport protein